MAERSMITVAPCSAMILARTGTAADRKVWRAFLPGGKFAALGVLGGPDALHLVVECIGKCPEFLGRKDLSALGQRLFLGLESASIRRFSACRTAMSASIWAMLERPNADSVKSRSWSIVRTDSTWRRRILRSRRTGQRDGNGTGDECRASEARRATHQNFVEMVRSKICSWS